jgi:uncharacterized protein DUF6174
MSRSTRRLLAIATLPALLAAAACNDTTTDPNTNVRVALQQAEAQWTTAAIHNYNFDMVTNDYIGVHDSAQVQVRGDSIVSATSYLSNQTTTSVETVPQLFSDLDTFVASGVPVQVAFDQQLGYPSFGAVLANTPAGGANWQIVNFTRLP